MTCWTLVVIGCRAWLGFGILWMRWLRYGIWGVFDPSTFATPNALEPSIGWPAGGVFHILCSHGQLICCVAVDCAAKGDPIMVALRILRDISHWNC
ncbi:hypothetical protein P8452_60646 [Trifolium repens]|nr:hypothetical protein P8452_60646 [Trifolium repens]